MPLSPVFSNLPPQIGVLEVTEAEPLTRLEGDLWKQSWSIKFSVKPPHGSANASALARATVSFAGDVGKNPTSAEFPIIIHRIYGIEAPELSHFGDVPLGERRSRRVVIRSADGRDFRVLGIRTEGEGFSTSGEAGKAAKSHILEAAFLASKPGSFQGHMIVETDHAECPNLRIGLAAEVPNAVASASGKSNARAKP